VLSDGSGTRLETASYSPDPTPDPSPGLVRWGCFFLGVPARTPIGGLPPHSGRCTIWHMAKKRRSATQIVRAFPVSRPAPIIIRQTSARAPKKVRHRRRSKAGSSSGLLAVALGGAMLGFLEKQFPNLPTLPIVGRAGTIAIAGHYIGKHMGGTFGTLLRDTSIAAAAIAGHELGSTGKISGDVDGDIPSQVRGIASQV